MKKRIKLIVILAVVLAVAAGCGGTFFAMKKAYAPVDRVTGIDASTKEDRYIMPIRLIAHRGFSALAPENTLAAADAAGMAKFYGCEFDLRLSADGQWFVMHDDDVSRMTDGEGLISEMTAEQIAGLTVDAGNNLIQHEGEKVPTAREMLSAVVKNHVRPVIEIKTAGAAAQYYKELADLIAELAGGEYDVISFHADVLREMKKFLPDASLWLLTSKVTTEQINSAAAEGFTGISINANNFLNHRYIDDIADSGLLVSAWTVDNIKLIDRLYAKGVYYFTTNYIQPA